MQKLDLGPILTRNKFSMTGPPRLLSDTEEEELVSFLKHCASIGYPRSKQDIMTLVQNAVTRIGHTGIVSHGWWDSFRKRHSEICLRKPEPLSHARVICTSPDILNKYFDLLEQTLEDNNLLQKPCQIFNCDESGFPLDPAPPKVAVIKGQKHPYNVSSGDKVQITVLACCSAGGYVIPPFIIFDRKTLKPGMTKGEVPGSIYGLSAKGWIDAELFDLWFHFLLHAPPVCPLLLLVDGHSSHYSPSVINRAAEEGVIMFCLPPHSTHITQPLDRGCFSALKRSWREECCNYRIENPYKLVSRYSFCSIFHKAWLKSMTTHNITTGFRITGVYPVNREAIIPGVELSPKIERLKKTVGISFIPLYSPFQKKTTSSVIEFTEEELLRFQMRYEEGYDLTTDTKYNKWLEMYHSGSKDSAQISSDEEDNSIRVLTPTTVLGRVISEQPTVKIPATEPKTSARVLTSEESRRMLMEKEEKKRQEAEEKAQRQAERQRKIGGKSESAF